jgi:hypothetical protein
LLSLYLSLSLSISLSLSLSLSLSGRIYYYPVAILAQDVQPNMQPKTPPKQPAGCPPAHVIQAHAEARKKAEASAKRVSDALAAAPWRVAEQAVAVTQSVPKQEEEAVIVTQSVPKQEEEADALTQYVAKQNEKVADALTQYVAKQEEEVTLYKVLPHSQASALTHAEFLRWSKRSSSSSSSSTTRLEDVARAAEADRLAQDEALKAEETAVVLEAMEELKYSFARNTWLRQKEARLAEERAVLEEADLAKRLKMLIDEMES